MIARWRQLSLPSSVPSEGRRCRGWGGQCERAARWLMVIAYSGGQEMPNLHRMCDECAEQFDAWVMHVDGEDPTGIALLHYEFLGNP